jgi:cation diffusion facilitator CzcD-associated flavoprotein CzcO
MYSVENHETVIIGGGAAGIGAALQLLQANRHDFVILEAQDRIGGRFHTLAYG